MAKLSIIVPVFNEERDLVEVVKHLMNSPCPIEREWIFVDDHSTDGSLAILRQLSDIHGFKVLHQPQNKGKGAAIIRALTEATGDLTMIQDADFEYDPQDIPVLLEPLLSNHADVVFGSRFKKSHQVHRTYHFTVNRILTLLSNLLSGIYLTDMETCYKIFRTPILKSMNLRSERFGIEVELTAYVAKLRLRIHEVPISYFPRRRLHGKKISWKDGIAALFHLVKFNLLISPEQAYKNIDELTSTLQKFYNSPKFNYLKKE